MFSCCPTKKVTKERELKISVSDSIQEKKLKKQNLVINTELISHREVVSEQMIRAYCDEKGNVVINESKISSGNNKASVNLVDNGFMLRLELGAYEEKNKELLFDISRLEATIKNKDSKISELENKVIVKTKYPKLFWYLLVALSASIYLHFNTKPISFIRKLLRF